MYLLTTMYNYHNLNHSITEGNDYVRETMDVGISSGEINVPYNFLITDDDIFGGNESFNVTIDSSSLPSRVLVQPDCVLMVTVVDNDCELCVI